MVLYNLWVSFPSGKRFVLQVGTLSEALNRAKYGKFSPSSGIYPSTAFARAPKKCRGCPDMSATARRYEVATVKRCIGPSEVLVRIEREVSTRPVVQCAWCEMWIRNWPKTARRLPDGRRAEAICMHCLSFKDLPQCHVCRCYIVGQRHYRWSHPALPDVPFEQRICEYCVHEHPPLAPAFEARVTTLEHGQVIETKTDTNVTKSLCLTAEETSELLEAWRIAYGEKFTYSVEEAE